MVNRPSSVWEQRATCHALLPPRYCQWVIHMGSVVGLKPHLHLWECFYSSAIHCSRWHHHKVTLFTSSHSACDEERDSWCRLQERFSRSFYWKHMMVSSLSTLASETCRVNMIIWTQENWSVTIFDHTKRYTCMGLVSQLLLSSCILSLGFGVLLCIIFFKGNI